MPHTHRTLCVSTSIAALLIAAVACGDDSTGPEPPTTVEITVTEVRGPFVEPFGSEGYPTIRCDVALRALLTGPKQATWGDAKLRFFAGPDRSKPVDSTTIAATEIGQSWDRATIVPGQPLESQWSFTGYFPFAVELEYHYRTSSAGSPAAAKAFFRCGPDVPPNTPAPVVSLRTPQSPPLETGDELVVEFSASSTIGLWQTAVQLSGPCVVEQTFPDQLQLTVTHVARLRIPPECLYGVPIRLTVLVLDIAARDASASVLTTLQLVDHTPPHVSASLIMREVVPPAEVASGNWFTGDSIAVILNASDKAMLHAVYWELVPEHGARLIDSALVSSTWYANQLRIPIPPEWVGTVDLRFFATDAAGFTSDTVKTRSGALRVYPTVERPTVSAEFAGEVRELAIDDRRGRLYLLQANEARLAIVTTRLEPITVVPLGVPATDLDLTAGGDSLLLALPSARALGVIDLSQPALAMTTIALTALDPALDQRPRFLRAASNGKALVSLTGSSAESYTLLEVNLGTGTSRIRTDAGYGGVVNDAKIERSHDHSAIVFNDGPWSFQRYDAATDAFGPVRAEFPQYERATVDGSGQHVAIGLDVYDASLQFLRKVNSVFETSGIPTTALSADGEYLHQIIWGLGVVRARVSDGALVDRTLNPISPSLMRVSPDGTMLVTWEGVGRPATKVSVIDLR